MNTSVTPWSGGIGTASSKEVDWPALRVELPPPVPPATSAPKPAFSFEQLLGARAFAWVGALAIALAGVFLVKYSIDQGYLGPTTRVVLAGVLGFVLRGDEDLQRRIVDSTMAQLPVVGRQISENVGSLRGSTVAIVIGLLGAMWAGAIAVAVNPRIPAEEWRTVLGLADFRLVLAESAEDTPLPWRERYRAHCRPSARRARRRAS